MNKVEDKVFGMMEYVYSWESTEEISVFGKDYDIRVVAEAYSGQEILDVQRDAYKKYKENFPKYVMQIPEILLDYYKSNYDTISERVEIPEKISVRNINKELIVKLIKIRTIYFDRKGAFGWLCDCAWDNEHGISIILSDEKPFVAEQDYLL